MWVCVCVCCQCVSVPNLFLWWFCIILFEETPHRNWTKFILKIRNNVEHTWIEMKWHTSNNAENIHNAKMIMLSLTHTHTHTHTHTRGYKNCSLIICQIKLSKMHSHHKNKLVTRTHQQCMHRYTQIYRKYFYSGFSPFYVLFVKKKNNFPFQF